VTGWGRARLGAHLGPALRALLVHAGPDVEGAVDLGDACGRSSRAALSRPAQAGLPHSGAAPHHPAHLAAGARARPRSAACAPYATAACCTASMPSPAANTAGASASWAAMAGGMRGTLMEHLHLVVGELPVAELVRVVRMLILPGCVEQVRRLEGAAWRRGCWLATRGARHGINIQQKPCLEYDAAYRGRCATSLPAAPAR
jgi:hypothetical protein